MGLLQGINPLRKFEHHPEGSVTKQVCYCSAILDAQPDLGSLSWDYSYLKGQVLFYAHRYLQPNYNYLLFSGILFIELFLNPTSKPGRKSVPFMPGCNTHTEVFVPPDYGWP